MTLKTATDETELEPRQLSIDLEVPQIQYLHTACIRPLDQKLISSVHSHLTLVGSPFLAELSMRYTRHWDLSSQADDLTRPIDFYYDICAEPAAWLILGQTHGSFSLRPGEDQQYHIVLIPLRTGFARFPTVEILPREADAITGRPYRASAEIDSGADHSLVESELSCETDCVSRHRGVIVIEDIQNTTLGIGSHSSLKSGIDMLCSDLRPQSCDVR